MNTSAAPNQLWLSIATQVVTEISVLKGRKDDQMLRGLKGDLAQLFTIGNQLATFCARKDVRLSKDQRYLWHELRNLAGTVQGYCELIVEEYPACDQHPQLVSICSLCRELLSYETQRENHPLSSSLHLRSHSVASATLLVVDDRLESREILFRYFRNSHHRLVEAESGVQMFTRLSDESIDLILLDLILPDSDGYELLLKLKGDPQWRDIPVIVISGSQDQERIVRCIEAGAEDYQFKPFNPVLLLARVNACLERKQWLDREKQYRDELERNQRFIRSVFGRYLSDEIVEQLLENPDGLNLGGEERIVTVMMADINGFSTICETLPPSRVVKLLNNYLGGMSEIVMAHSGTVDEFIGDAILALFGAPVTRSDDADRAIACALNMQRAMAAINQRNLADGLPEISISIALNTGPVVAGNIGSEKRAKYGVVGHTVNQTSRMQDACGKGRIVVSQSTADTITLKFALGDRRNIKAKGIFAAITLYELETELTRNAEKIHD